MTMPMRSLGLALALGGCGGGAPAPATPRPLPPLGADDNAFVTRLGQQLSDLWDPAIDAPDAMVCVRFDPAGRVTRGSLKATTGNPAHDASYARLIDMLKAARAAAPEPPPPALAARLVDDPVCVKLVVSP